MVSTINIFVVLSMVASAFGSVLPVVPYASSFNAHTINHAVATPLISAPLPIPAALAHPVPAALAHPVPAAFTAPLPVPAALAHPVPAAFTAPHPFGAPVSPIVSPYAAHPAFGYPHLRYPHPYLF